MITLTVSIVPVLLLISIMAILLIDSPLEALELKYKYAWVKSIFQIGFPLLLATVTIIKNIKEKLKKLSS